MKALNEIGKKKLASFIYFSIVQVFYHLIIDHIFFFPPARKLFWEVMGAKIGKDAVIMNVHFFNLHYEGLRGLKIGKDCFLGDEALIDLYNKVTLEDQVTIAQKVVILTHTNVGYLDHPLQKIYPKKSQPIIIKKGSVIGANVTILPGITIGEKSFIGAGSVVTKDIPKNSLAVGNPAKVIKKLS